MLPCGLPGQCQPLVLAVCQVAYLLRHQIVGKPLIAQAVGLHQPLLVLRAWQHLQEGLDLQPVVEALAEFDMQLGKAVKPFDAVGEAAEQRLAGDFARDGIATFGAVGYQYQCAWQGQPALGAEAAEYRSVSLCLQLAGQMWSLPGQRQFEVGAQQADVLIIQGLVGQAQFQFRQQLFLTQLV